MTNGSKPALDPPAVCTRCGLSTTLPQLLSKRSRSFRLSASRDLACPRCIASSRAKFRFAILCMYGLVAIGFALSSSPTNPWSSDPLSPMRLLAQMAVLEPIMMAMHELSHAAVGWAVGFRVFGIELGTGPDVARCWLGDFLFHVHLVPVGGICYASPKKTVGIRWRSIFFVAAGALFHALSLALLVAFYWSRRDPSQAFYRHEGWIAALTLLNFLMLLRNLWPRDISRQGRKIPNDGKQLRRLLKSTNIDLNAYLNSRDMKELDLCFEKSRLAEARSWLGRLQARNSKSLLIASYELNLLGAEKRWPDVLAKATEWKSVYSGPFGASVLSAWAAVALVYEGGNLAEAERLCGESMALVPWDPSTQSIHALVLLAGGRTDEAETFLRKSGSEASWAARAGAARMWAELYRRRGNAKRQRKWESRASSLDPGGAFQMPRRKDPAPTA
jgi:hypothetical protein